MTKKTRAGVGRGKAKAHRTKSFDKKHGITKAMKDFVKRGNAELGKSTKKYAVENHRAMIKKLQGRTDKISKAKLKQLQGK